MSTPAQRAQSAAEPKAPNLTKPLSAELYQHLTGQIDA